MAGPLQNAKHERFCREFATGETLSAAYVRAGYTDSRNARFNASRLRNTPACRERINELMAQFADAATVKVQYLQASIVPILQASALDFFDETGKLKPLATLQRECASAIKALKFDRKTGKLTEIVLADKIAAANTLLRSIGIGDEGSKMLIMAILQKQVSTWTDADVRLIEQHLAAIEPQPSSEEVAA
jgi:hypothetical protein